MIFVHKPKRFLAQLFVVVLLLFCATIIVAQSTEGARLYNDSGSIAPIDTNYYGLNTPSNNFANSYYVAQNFSPAPITPSSTTTTTPAPISLSTPSFDPYAITDQLVLPSNIPNNTANNTANNYMNFGGTYSSSNFDNFFPETVTTMRKFREATHVGYQYIPRGNSENANTFGMQELDIRMQFAIPCRFIPDYRSGTNGSGSIYIAPGGSLYWWNGPGNVDVAANGFATYIDFGIKPQITEFFSFESWLRFGAYSDFKKIDSDSLRFQGEIVGKFHTSQQFNIVVGGRYVARQRYKMLPVIGFEWIPRDDWLFCIMFPKTKISKRIWSDGRVIAWGYVQGELAGESWRWQHTGKTDYNDIKIGVGCDFQWSNQVNGFVELGGSFDRELYSQNYKWLTPRSVFYFKLGVGF
ncbi:MAG: hypothetical protein LBH59_10955 [Planctomycetaceae bacterium]|jgi:hypothetical protein|nr:hypothetical protein [Planctomycetaceae bacterium]